LAEGDALVGHSSGGGFALRVAEGPESRMFARYVLLAPTYSFVTQQDFFTPRDDLERVGQVRAPLALPVGALDEISYADRFAPLLDPLRPGTSIQVLRGVDHMGLITQPDAIAAVVETLRH